MKIRRPAAALCIAIPALLLSGCFGESEESLIASGKEYLEKNDPKAAQIQLKSALQKNADSAEARTLLGKALLAGGDPAAAVVELGKALELKASEDDVVPDLARAMLAIGEEGKLVTQYGSLRLKGETAAADLRSSVATAYLMQGQVDKAREAVQLALLAQPTYAPALILRARLLAADDDIDGALAVLDQVLGRDPAEYRAGVLKGEILRIGKKDEAGAMQAFRKVLETRPETVAAHSAIVTMFYEQGKPDEAKAQIEQMKMVAPNHPDTLFFQAQVAFNDKDYKGSREITDRLLQAAPGNLRVLELAGAAEYRLRNYPQAENFLGQVIKGAPGALLPRHLLAQTYLRSGQPNKTIEVLQPVLESKQVDGTSLALAGEAYLQMGDARRSEEAFRLATQAAPDNARVRTSAAIAQMSRGNNAAAVAELEKIAAGDGGPRADLALVSARLRQNDIPGALKAIDALEAKLPDQALPHNLRGRVLLLKNDLPAATASFEAALAKDPKYFPAVASLAAMDLNAGKPEAARKRFENLIKVDPANYQARLALAEISSRSGAVPEEVARLISEAVRSSPAEPAPRLMLVNHYLALGDTKSAMTAAQDATATLPNNLLIMDALGRAQFASGQGQQAVSTFKKLAALQPTNPLHLTRLADAHVATGDTASAAAALRRALELRPGMVPAKRGLAAIALLENRPRDALAIAREMQKSDPKSAVGYLLEGDAEAFGRNWPAAATAFRASLQRDPASGTAVKLHNALNAGGKRAEADRMAAGWLKDHPQDAAFRFYLGDAALSRRDFAAAETYYRAVVDLQPKNALALNNVAWLMVQQGKPGALAMAEKANELLPDRAPLLDTLATAQAAENQVAKAIKTQQRAIQRSPDDPSLKLNLARLYIKSGEKDFARAELEALAKLGDKFPAQAEVSNLLKSI